jgi:Uma2 family endonuclease
MGAVFLKDGQAEDRQSHWVGPADFLVEIVSPEDRTREKLPFYSALGVRELLIVDRQPWALELYRRHEGALGLIAKAQPDDGQRLASDVVPLEFQLVAGDARPRILVGHPLSGRMWRL